jgi:hypothetical protein
MLLKNLPSHLNALEAQARELTLENLLIQDLAKKA